MMYPESNKLIKKAPSVLNLPVERKSKLNPIATIVLLIYQLSLPTYY